MGDENKIEGGKVVALPKGPYLVTGCTVINSKGDVVEGDKLALCACGASKNKPFCDGEHKTTPHGQE